MSDIKKAMPVGHDLAEQLSIWIEESDWSGQEVYVSRTPDPDVASVALYFRPYRNDRTGRILVYALSCQLSEDFELVSREPLAGTDGRTDYIVFTVKSL
jgi:hypothetical protein